MHLSAGRTLGVACAVVLSVSAVCCKRQTGVPAAGLLVGNWTLTTDSLTLARSMGFSKTGVGDHQIVLLPDQKCQFRSYWHFDSDRARLREGDYVSTSAECSWRVSAAEVVARRTSVVGAVELSVWEPGLIERAAFVDLQAEERGGRLYLLATSGHPDENGPRFLYERVGQ